MSDDKPLKTAYEIAMERLLKQDRERGEEESGPLTDAQKEEIARVRQETQAKLAELEILHKDALKATGGDPAKIQELEEKYRVDRERVESRAESAIARIRKGGGKPSS